MASLIIDMQILAHPQFRKHYKKRIIPDTKLDKRVKERVHFFADNPKHPILKDHALTGTLTGKRAFSVTGDILIIYEQIDENTVRFLDIGSHNQVY